MIYLYTIIFFSLIFQNNLDTIPKLDLRNSKGIKLHELSLENIISDSRISKSIHLSLNEIDIIKNKAKLFVPSPVNKDDIIVISTNKGVMKFKFYVDMAPNHCYNFKKLANSSFYDETLFHRVIKNFIIQGGDILSRDNNTGNDGLGGPGWTIDAELSKIRHIKGTLSMSKSATNINSAGSQFFISLNNNSNLDNNYTVFGYIVEGEYVLDLLSKSTTEHDQAMMLVKNTIPIDADSSNWVEIIDNSINKVFFADVPEFMNKEIYKKAIEKKLMDLYTPSAPIIIQSIRVESEQN